jgi:hypothetical protein
MTSFRNIDAVLDLSDPDAPREPDWPGADFIVGNPPFLGGKRLRAELGDDYVDSLFTVYKGGVPAEADLVAYWFEKARRQIERGCFTPTCAGPERSAASATALTTAAAASPESA